MFNEVRDMVFTETVRGDEGGTNGVSVQGGISKLPVEQSNVQIYFDTDPERRARMVEVVEEGIENFKKNGPEAEKLAKVKEFMLKKYQENQKENGSWLGALYEYYWNGVDRKTDYEATVNSITADDIKTYINKLFDQNNRIEVIMTGVKEN